MGVTRRARKVSTEQEIKQLEANPNVRHVSGKNITYSPDFKVAAIKAYHEGQTPIEIFLKAGFKMDIFGHEKPKKMLLL
ncbi:HTH domain-containing protein [Paenibacillus apiarius]|uniref:HTH domain-containing protein n=1 Tax=Paenibacillus apiarius TaxID=46240 RepID=UPI00197DAED0|nr:HTH domain-containing protein [Paenibacillus apiarius]MBN3523370.1 hypothetical protein [Paenibacillus apiarius]